MSDFSNLVKTATCFTKIAEPSLLDVIISNRPNHCQNIRNFNFELSDCHNIISFQLKGYVPKMNLDNIFVMKRGKTLNSFLVFKYRLMSTINTIFWFVNPTLY